MADFDAANDGQKAATGTTFNISITVGNNSNRAIYVSVTTGGNGVGSSVTFGGTSDSITELYDDGSSPTFANIALHRILNPQVGTFNVTVTVDSAVPATGSAISVYNVDQASPNGTVASYNATTVSQSALSVSTASGKLCLGWVWINRSEAFTALNGQTEDTNELNSTENYRFVGGHIVASGATQSVDWSSPVSADCRAVGVSLNTASGAAESGVTVNIGGLRPNAFAPGLAR